MPLSLRDAVVGILIPLLVAGVVTWLTGKRWPARANLAAHLGITTGFLAGWVGLVGAGRPTTHWQWLPVLLSALLVPAALLDRRRVLAWLVYAVLLAAAAWWLVPEWKSLQPVRIRIVAGLFGVCCGLAMVLRRLTVRCCVHQRLGLYSVLGLTAAILIFLADTASISQVAGLGTAAVAGLWLASVPPGGAQSMSPDFGMALLLPAVLLAGRLNSFSGVPDGCYVLVCAAPCLLLPLRVAAGGRVIRNRWLLLPTAACAAAVAWALYAEWDSIQEML